MKLAYLTGRFVAIRGSKAGSFRNLVQAINFLKGE